MTDREKLVAAIAARDEHKKLLDAKCNEADAKYRQEVIDEARRKFPRRKYIDGHIESAQKAIKALGDDVKPIVEKWRGKADELFAEHRAEQKKLDEEVTRLAASLKPQRGDTRRTYSSHWVSTHRSQGWAAERYASGRAEIDCEFVESHGIEAVVVHDTSGLDSYDVLVMVDAEVDVEIIKSQPFSLRDFIKACWARSLNPRVYDPFIPHGAEERLGIDYQGRDVKKP